MTSPSITLAGNMAPATPSLSMLPSEIREQIFSLCFPSEHTQAMWYCRPQTTLQDVDCDISDLFKSDSQYKQSRLSEITGERTTGETSDELCWGPGPCSNKAVIRGCCWSCNQTRATALLYTDRRTYKEASPYLYQNTTVGIRSARDFVDFVMSTRSHGLSKYIRKLRLDFELLEGAYDVWELLENLKPDAFRTAFPQLEVLKLAFPGKPESVIGYRWWLSYDFIDCAEAQHLCSILSVLTELLSVYEKLEVEVLGLLSPKNARVIENRLMRRGNDNEEMAAMTFEQRGEAKRERLRATGQEDAFEEKLL